MKFRSPFSTLKTASLLSLLFFYGALSSTAHAVATEPTASAESILPKTAPPNPNSNHWYHHRADIMGTQIQMSFWLEDKQAASNAKQAVIKNLHRIDQAYSPYKPTSRLSQLNAQAPKGPTKISKEFSYLLDKSLYYSKLTQGAFDITFASLGFHYNYRNKKQPTQTQIRNLQPAINYQWVTLNTDKLTASYKHPNVKVDLGGIAKGHAVDQSIHILKEFGVKHATVSAGGDSKILGDKRGKPWLIGIKNPRLSGKPGERTTVLTLPLEDTAVSTSGDYERYFLDDTGKRIHHILNPKTGKPANGIISATVIGPNGIDTDALSTSVFVLGVDKALKLINRLPEFDCVIIDATGKVHFSAGLTPPGSP